MAKPSPDTLYSRKLFQKSILTCLTRRSSHRAACLRDTYPSRLHERQAVRGPSLHQAHSAKGSRGVTQRFARGPRHARRPVTAWPMAGHSTRRGAQRPAESSVGLIDALSLLRNIPAFAGERERPGGAGTPSPGGGEDEGDTQAPHADESQARRGTLRSTVGARDRPHRLPIHTHHCEDNGGDRGLRPRGRRRWDKGAGSVWEATGPSSGCGPQAWAAPQTPL